MSEASDLIVIGSGPGGYVAAIRAAQLGMRVTIVERDQLGGICLNWGCIPTKALLRTAEVFRLMREAKDFGLSADNVRFDPDALIQRSRKVAARLSGGVQFLMKKNKISVVSGTARLEKGAAAPRVVVKDQAGKETALEARHVILATGARARTLPNLKPDGARIWTYREAMTPPEWPKSLLVFGSGAIGVEFASFYANLGVDVTLVEAVDRILPVEDSEIAAFAHKRFERDGIKIHTGTMASSLKATDEGVEAEIDKSGARATLRATHAILAIGISGNVENLGLETLGVKLEKGHVVIDGLCRTNVAGLYAIGDVAGAPWLAHKASHEGVICVEAIAGKHPHSLQPGRVPGCTYSHPQIASIGLTEEKAKETGRPLKIGRFPFSANGKAIALGEPEGLVKTIFDADTGALLGAHMVGAEVTELIQGYAIAMAAEATEATLFETIFPHPTLSEMMHESALDAFQRALHT